MKISTMALGALSAALLSTAPAAYAGCGSCGSNMSYGHSGSTADCPPGTSPSSDGTCLMNSGSSLAGSSYGSSSSYSSGYSSGSTITSYASSRGMADCPSGTSRAGDGTCLMAGGSSMYMGSSSSYSPSTSYSSRTYGGSSSTYTPSTSYSSSSYSSSSNCPAGSTRSSDGICMSNNGSSSSSGSSSYSYSSTPLNSYRGQSSYVIDNRISSSMSDSEADYRYGSGSISGPYSDGSNTIVPFTTTSATLSNYRVPGMGANEFLSPTNCPVNVYNPGGAQVLGCYQVSKPAPVRVRVPNYHTVRVVRPIIYVRYPVPTPVPVAMPVCGSHHWHSRYGNNWPRGCGW